MDECTETRVSFYRQRMPLMVHVFNRIFPLPYYFFSMLPSRDALELDIADLGAGPICTIGGLWDHRKVRVVPSDVLQPHYQKILDEMGIELLIPTEYQDMEHLTYASESFDIVHIVNALDHTKGAKRALDEAVRICKVGGYVYLRHGLSQKRHQGGHHYWNANTDGSFSDGKERFWLEGATTTCDGHFVVSVWRKTV